MNRFTVRVRVRLLCFGSSDTELQICGEASVTILLMGQIQGTRLGFMFRCSVRCKNRIWLWLQCGSGSDVKAVSRLSFRFMVMSMGTVRVQVQEPGLGLGLGVW